MRTLCDACESAAAIVFCAADEAALCHACDEKVHMCNKLASRHVRVGLTSPSDVPCCDICENAPAFFYCETDGSSLCLQCDMMVHVGGKRTHLRHLLFRQKVEFPGDKPMDPGETKRGQNQLPKIKMGEKQQNHRMPLVLSPEPDADGHAMREANMIDLNMKPRRIHEYTSNNQNRVEMQLMRPQSQAHRGDIRNLGVATHRSRRPFVKTLFSSSSSLKRFNRIMN